MRYERLIHQLQRAQEQYEYTVRGLIANAFKDDEATSRRIWLQWLTGPCLISAARS